MARTMWIAVLGFALLSTAWGTFAHAQPIDRDKVARIKAAYIYHMLHLTEWPAPEDAGPVVILCLGGDTQAVGTILAEQAASRGVNGRPIRVEFRSGDAATDPDGIALAGVRIVYFGGDTDPATLARWRTHGRRALLAGDGPAFARRGGMVGFFVENDRVRINVNLAAVQTAGLHMSAEFLQHVDIVAPEEEG